MQRDDRNYGDMTDKKRIVQKDKYQKYRQNFRHMNVTDVMAMNEDEDYDFEDEYEPH
jgi:hypothetical protein